MIINDDGINNIFEFKYFPENNISTKNIFKAFDDVSISISYFTIIYEIYFIIDREIKDKYWKISQKGNQIHQQEIKNNKKFCLNNLYKWKFILSALYKI